MLLVPLHIGIWHAILEACLRREHLEQVTTRFKCPCDKRMFSRALNPKDVVVTARRDVAAHQQQGTPVTLMHSRAGQGHARLGSNTGGPHTSAGANARSQILAVDRHSANT